MSANLRSSWPIRLENGSMKNNIKAYCKLLLLSSVAENYEKAAMDAAKTKISYREYLYPKIPLFYSYVFCLVKV